MTSRPSSNLWLGSFDELLWLCNPFEPGRLNFFEQWRRVTAFNEGLAKEHPDFAAALFTHPAFPAEGGILPFAMDDEGRPFYWVTAGKPHRWTIVKLGRRPGEGVAFDVGTRKLLAQWLEGRIELFQVADVKHYSLPQPSGRRLRVEAALSPSDTAFKKNVRATRKTLVAIAGPARTVGEGDQEYNAEDHFVTAAHWLVGYREAEGWGTEAHARRAPGARSPHAPGDRGRRARPRRRRRGGDAGGARPVGLIFCRSGGGKAATIGERGRHMHQFSNVYYNVSGFGIHDCCFLGQHYLTAHGFRPDRGESWALRSTQPPPGRLGLQLGYGVPGWFTGMWRSANGVVYVTELLGRIHICRNLDSMGAPETWERVDFKNTIMQGVWGLNDQCVFAWCKIGLKLSMLFWNGQTWAEIAAPPEEVAGMHGVSPEVVYAVGANGLIARWDGKAWTRAVVPTQEFLISVHVSSPDEMYAVGHGQALWEGSTSGWGKVADGPGVLQGVAKFGGDVWVGGQKEGLLRREGNKLVVVNSDLHVNALDSRKVLLMTTYDEIAETTDGKAFTTKAKGVMGQVRDSKTPLWGHEPDPDDEEEEDDED